MTDSDSKPPRITINLRISDSTLTLLREMAPGYRVDRQYGDIPDSVWADTEILFTGRVYPLPEQAPRLRWIQITSAGFDGALKNPVVQVPDIEVTSVSGIHATPIAEYCLSMMLALNLNMAKMFDLKRKIEWPANSAALFGPAPLRGKTVGIVGYGSIGRELARLCAALGMTVLASKRDLRKVEQRETYQEPGTGDPAGEIPLRLYPGEAISTMARDCDFLVITVPLTGGTTRMIDARVLSAMKPTAALINIARGAIIDEPALITALQEGKISGAALDVFAEEPLPTTNPLWTLENVIISPHVSGDTPDYTERSARVFAENLRRYLERRPLINALDRTRGY